MCSDTSAGRNRDEIGDFTELEIPVTTDPEKIGEALSRSYRDVDMLVTFSTYQSIKLISEAQHSAGAPPFDLMFCDEAHRTTGAQIITDTDSRGTSVFLMPHDNQFVEADKRVYMTATPKIWSSRSNNAYRKAEVFSMDDKSQFGPVLYQMKFSEAIDKGLLSDYYLVGLTIDPNCQAQLAQLGFDPELTRSEQAKLYGAVKGVSTEDNNVPHLRRSISFTNTIKRSRQHQLALEVASDRLREMSLVNGNPVPFQVRTKHIDGKTKANIRRQSLDWLKEPEDGECRIITNARCLSEGVDVPTLDAALFMSPKHSAIDIVQQVGRVMRKAPGKTHGYIVVPIMLAEGDTAKDALRKSEDYATIIKVVRALRSHDDNIDQLINQNRFSEKLRLVPVPEVFGTTDTELTVREQEEAIQGALFTPDALIDALNVLVFEDCGDRQYWAKWAKDVGSKTVELQEKMNTHLNSSVHARERFDRFMTGIRETVSPDMSEHEAMGMLAQHLVTQPVFDAFFENYEFSNNNPVSQIMSDVTEEIVAQDLHSELRRSMAPFYESVQKRIRGINDPTTRHEVLKELYETFLKTAFPESTDLLGVVYTPVEIVDWLLHSADEVFRQEFGVGIGDKGVEVLDPFSGTGTFLTRLIESDLISDEQLDHKYQNELSAIEILPTAYYLSAINIEEAYHGRKTSIEDNHEYTPFPGIALGDTFTLLSEEYFDLGLFGIEESNTPKLNEINRKDIKLMAGNPPWRAWQGDAIDQNPNRGYAALDRRITETYAARSTTSLKNSLQDMYLKAIRWASDRIGNKGILAFVTNGGWLDGSAATGVRDCFAEEFSTIYCYNLRGKIPSSREEGGNVFNVKVSITLIILVKNPDKLGKATIYYAESQDCLTGYQKLQELAINNSLSKTTWKSITPDERNDWINKTDINYQSYQAIGDLDTRKNRTNDGIFRLYSGGLKTGRDLWAYDSNEYNLYSRTYEMIDFYNEQLYLGYETDPELDPSIIKWHDITKRHLKRGRRAEMADFRFKDVMYRPFFIQNVHYDPIFNNSHYYLDRVFPTRDTDNLVIDISGKSAQEFDRFMTRYMGDISFETGCGQGTQDSSTAMPNLAICSMDKPGSREFSVFMTTKIPDLELVHHNQVFPLWQYQKIEAGQQGGIFDEVIAPEGYVVEDNILDETLDDYREHYGDTQIAKDDIFYYVYGILHHPDYKTKYRNDLRKGLPRIPKAPDFWGFCRSGRKLGHLHVDYSELDGCRLEQRTSILFDPTNDNHYRFVKLKMTVKGNEVEIKINEHLTLAGIPSRALEYVVNGKSGLGWIVDRYRIREDTKHGSGIVNDANALFGDPREFVKLIEQVVQVSLESVDIIESLPAEFEEPQDGGNPD